MKPSVLVVDDERSVADLLVRGPCPWADAEPEVTVRLELHGHGERPVVGGNDHGHLQVPALVPARVQSEHGDLTARRGAERPCTGYRHRAHV